MQHRSTVKVFLYLPFLFAAAWADEATDRSAIAKAVAALNEFPPRAELFTADTDAHSALDQLWRGTEPLYRIELKGADGPAVSSSAVVRISHEPWGEATIDFPGVTQLPSVGHVEVLNPRIVLGVVRFISPDVAIADGDCRYESASANAAQTPILFVMKKEGGDWKIASIRRLAGEIKTPPKSDH